jgi:hypothetical protein
VSDLDLLLAAFDRGDLLRPDHAVPNVVDLARALATLAGAANVPETPGSDLIANLIGPSDHLVFVLADGLGMNLLARLPDTAFFSRHLVAELRSVFPSTTATVLTTFASGAWPSQHGVTGQWTHLTEIRGAAALLPFASRSGGHLLSHLGVTIEQAFPLPSVMKRMTRDVAALLPMSLVNSPSSAYFTGGRRRIGYESLATTVELILERIATAKSPTYTYLYSPRIDAEEHWQGVTNGDAIGVVNELNRVIERLANGLAGRGRIVVAADHGMLDVPVSARHGFKPSDDIFDALRFGPSGDDRVLYFHLRAGSEDRVRRRIKARYGDRFLLLTVAEAEGLHLFGPEPITPALRDRFGDLIMLSSGVDMVEYAPSGRVGHRVDLNAFHSGLSPAEMRVPLIIA